MQSTPPPTTTKPTISLRVNVRISLGLLAMFLLKAWRATAFGVHGYLNFTKSGFLEHSKSFNPEDMAKRIDGKNCIVTGANSGIGYATAHGLASSCHVLLYFDTNPEDMAKRIDGKNCIVTGANSGIGYATAHGLASRGATVYMVCRNKERGEVAVSNIQSVTGNQNVYLEVCDLSSVNDVKSFSSRFREKDVPIHVLVNNAGILENKRVTTSEGYEMNFAVNVLGTYGMTELMLPLLEKSQPDARVITVGSGGMYTAPLTTDLQFDSGEFNGVEQYSRNKRVQVALTEKWAEKYGNKGIGFYAMHPGWAETPGVSKSLPSFSESFKGKLRTSDEGADTIIWLALQPKEKLVPGGFYFDRAEAPKHLAFSATKNSHTAINSIIDTLNSFGNFQI